MTFCLTTDIIEASMDAMLICNEKDTIRVLNTAAVTMFGYSRKQLIGIKISVILGANEYFSSYQESGRQNFINKKYETRAVRKDGSEFPIELTTAETKTLEGKERAICFFIKDLSRLKRKEKRDEARIPTRSRSSQSIRKIVQSDDRDMEKEDLERSISFTRGIVQASLDAIFLTNERGIIEIVNDAAVKQFGWTEEEMIGKNIKMIMRSEHAKNHDEHMSKYIKTSKSHVLGMRRELPARRKDGSEFIAEISINDISWNGKEQKFCGFIRDLTQQKNHEKELQREYNITKGIIEASFDALVAMEENGKIVMVNQASCAKLGWSRDELVGSDTTIIMDDFHAKHHHNFLEDYLRTGVRKFIGVQREVQIKKKDGSYFPAYIGITEVKNVGYPTFFVGFIRDLTEEKKMMEVQIEKARADALLFNMLPENIAQRLKGDPSHIADHYASTTILFADIVGFTEMSSRLSPMDLVKMLNDLFSRFDDLVDKYCLNKVKTIGDCYMVTSVPSNEENDSGCTSVCFFGLDMIKAIKDFNFENDGIDLNLRIGINTGPVVAGIVGTKRFLYDLWGDAVNTASRMESCGMPGRIQVTGEVVKLTKDVFHFESRGLMHVKGKGEMETFIL